MRALQMPGDATPLPFSVDDEIVPNKADFLQT